MNWYFPINNSTKSFFLKYFVLSFLFVYLIQMQGFDYILTYQMKQCYLNLYENLSIFMTKDKQF